MKEDYGEENVAFVTRHLTVTKILIAINVLVFTALNITGDTSDGMFMQEHGAMWTDAVIKNKEIYRLLTAAFLHFDISHLFGNMLLLLFMGEVLEAGKGWLKFILIYLGAAAGGNAASLLVELVTDERSVSAGASGAIFGVLGALIFLILQNHGRYFYMTGKRLAFFAALSLYSGFTTRGVDNAAHVGGLLTGFVLAMLICQTEKNALDK